LDSAPRQGAYSDAVVMGLLEVLDDVDRRSVLSKMTRRSYRKGDTLYFEGDPGESLHVLQKGCVAVRVSTPYGDVATLTVLGPGESFGELALLGADSLRTATVVALEAVETRALHRRDFDELRRQHPAVEQLLVEALAAQVRRLSSQVLDALYVPADKRVIRRIADLAKLYDDGSAVICVPVRQDDIASMAGTTRPTANRVLMSLQADGLVSLARGRTDVLDLPGLQRRAR
jgi:CRP/FNR family transcriptional regulator, cyclic AMP receptor protein